MKLRAAGRTGPADQILPAQMAQMQWCCEGGENHRHGHGWHQSERHFQHHCYYPLSKTDADTIRSSDPNRARVWADRVTTQSSSIGPGRGMSDPVRAERAFGTGNDFGQLRRVVQDSLPVAVPERITFNRGNTSSKLFGCQSLSRVPVFLAIPLPAGCISPESADGG